jgi:hypothetical protein
MTREEELKYLRHCVELAKMALDDGNEPFGSVLVASSGKVPWRPRTGLPRVTVPAIPSLSLRAGRRQT